MTHHELAKKAILICSAYGLLSILQTLNSRFLYKTLQFDYYSFIFAIQKFINIIVFSALGILKFQTKNLLHILPFAAFMCLSNVISSYCLTIMPLAGFMAFKKLVIVFVLGVSLVLKFPAKLTRTQHICMILIVVGGMMVAEKEVLMGDTKGYIACLAFNLFEALSIQYAAFLYREKNFEPQDLVVYNSLISLPYYMSVILYEGEMPEITEYLSTKTSLTYVFIMISSVFLACTSELAANYITMKISPFEKAIISNIKDLILVIFSIFWFFDFNLTLLSGSGIILCLGGSLLFSVPYLSQQKEDQLDKEKQNTFMKQVPKEAQKLLQNSEEVEEVKLSEEIDDKSTQ